MRGGELTSSVIHCTWFVDSLLTTTAVRKTSLCEMDELGAAIETMESGSVELKLVGTEEDVVYHEFSRLLSDGEGYLAMSHASNPYGDGHASWRSVNVLKGPKAW